MKKYGICAIIKDEQEYLEEWIKWNLEIGFSEIYLYEDTGSKSHSEITDKYPQVHLGSFSEVPDTFEPHQKVGSWKQKLLFDWFARGHKDDLDWVAFIDPDEYINFEEGWDLEKLVSYFGSDISGLYLKWKVYGASGHIKKPKGSVVDNYKNEGIFEENPCWSCKSLVNLKSYFGFMSNHVVYYGFTTLGVPNPEAITYDKAWINHYYTKSWEDWMTQVLKRGDLSTSNRRIYQFFEVNPDMEIHRSWLLNEYLEQLDLDSKELQIYTLIDSPDQEKFPFSKNYTLLSIFKGEGTVDISEATNFPESGSTYTALNWISSHIPENKKYVGFTLYDKYFQEFFENSSDEKLDSIFEKHDIILPEKKYFQEPVSKIPEKFKGKEIKHMGENPKTQYVKDVFTEYSLFHNQEDWLLLGKCIQEIDPDYYEDWLKFSTSPYIYPDNLFIMKTSDFIKYQKFIETVISRFLDFCGFKEDQDIKESIYLRIEKYHPEDFSMLGDCLNYQSRVIRYLMNHLSNIWYLHNTKAPYEAKVLTLNE